MSILVYSSNPTVEPQGSVSESGRTESGESGQGRGEKDPCGRAPETEQDVAAAPRFREILRLFAEFDEAGDTTNLFPKTCRVCAKSFRRFSEYLCATSPKGHVFEDCAEVMGRPFTMVYRHCPCGNTLVLTLTEDNFPALGLFWSLLREEAGKCDRPLSAVVTDFSVECDKYLLLLHNPCTARERSNDEVGTGPGRED